MILLKTVPLTTVFLTNKTQQVENVEGQLAECLTVEPMLSRLWLDVNWNADAGRGKHPLCHFYLMIC